LILSQNDAYAACDCGSSDGNNPCSGQSISVTVKTLSTHRPNSRDAVFKWSFNSGGGDAYCGQFANGDYWIAPQAGTSVQITSVTGNGPISVDANPVMESMGLLDGSRTYGNYNHNENILNHLPVSYSTTTSLVAAIQRDEKATSNCGTAAIVGECVDAYHVVTILPEVPANSGRTMLRPNITGESKVLLTLADFDFSRLPTSSILAGTSLAGLENIRTRWSHSTEIFGLAHDIRRYYSEGGRAFRAHILNHDYGAGVAQSFNNDMMIMFSEDHPIGEKLPALAAMLTYGHDLYHAMFNAPDETNRHWGVGATQHAGKFMPAVLLAALMRDDTYAKNLKKVGPNVHDTAHSGPHELAQVHNGPNGPVWGDVSPFGGSHIEGSYWVNALKSQCFEGATGEWGGCNPGIGPKTERDPYGYIDGPPNLPGSSYFVTSAGVQRAMVAAMMLMPEICEIINYDPLIEFIDRLDNVGIKAFPDPCAAPDPRENPSNCDAYRDRGCVYYKITWGPDPDNPGQCIKDGIGRFPNRHGAKAGYGYTSWQVEANWPELRNTAGSCLKPAKEKTMILR
jgi:hypothetical protein